MGNRLINRITMENKQKIVKKVDKTRKRVFRLVSLFNILSDQSCFRVFRSLVKYDKLTIEDVTKILKISDSVALKCLNRLEMNGILIKIETESNVYYSLNLKKLEVKAIKIFFK